MRKLVLSSLFLVLAAVGAFAQEAPALPAFLNGAACPALSPATGAGPQPLWAGGGGGIAPDCPGQCYSEYLSCTPNFCCGNNPGCPYQLDCYEQYQECLRCCNVIHQTCTLC